jgi:hypothetical protein
MSRYSRCKGTQESSNQRTDARRLKRNSLRRLPAKQPSEDAEEPVTFSFPSPYRLSLSLSLSFIIDSLVESSCSDYFDVPFDTQPVRSSTDLVRSSYRRLRISCEQQIFLRKNPQKKGHRGGDGVGTKRDDQSGRHAVG